MSIQLSECQLFSLPSRKPQAMRVPNTPCEFDGFSKIQADFFGRVGEVESAMIVRVDGTPDPQYVNGKTDSLGRTYPPHVVIEQFNVLPPD